MADHWLIATGNWNDPNTWSTTESGGAPGTTYPGSGDNVFLDAASGAVTLTVNVASDCLNFDCTGFTGTLAGTQTLSVWGTVFKLAAGMTQKSALPYQFRSTSGTTAITMGGKSTVGSLIFNGFGGTFQLQDKLTCVNNFTLINGTFDANGQDVLFTGIDGVITGDISFYNLERKPTTAAAVRSLTLSSNITVTNNLVLDSNSTDADKRLLIRSSVRGTQRTITCNGTVTANYCDFEDIKGAGSADWDLSAATGGSGNCGGNSDITFTTPDDCYQVWAGGPYSFSNPSIWSETSGGTAGQRVPLPQDTAILDANSTTGTMTQNMQRIGSINCTGFTGTLTTSTTCTCYGSITLSSGMTLTNSLHAYTLAGRGTHTLTSAGKTWAKPFVIDAPGGSYTLQDNWTQPITQGITLTRGTFDANDFNLTSQSFTRSGTNIATLDLGNGTWEMIGTGTCWNISSLTDLTITPGTSLIKLTGAMSGFSNQLMIGTYHSIEIATTGAGGPTLRNGPTFNNFKVAPGSNVRFYRSQTVTAATWELTGTSGSPITLASDTTTAATIAKSGGGTVTMDYATVTYLTGSPASTFYATNSTDGGNNSQITFSAPPGGYRPSVIFID